MTERRVVAVVQARMTSTRLPGKSLAALGHSTLLGWTTTRVGAAERVDEVVVATSTDREDDVIAEAAAVAGLRCVRGSRDDVLSRYRDAVEAIGVDIVVRVTADCPFLAPKIVDATVAALDAGGDYASTNLERKIPHGLDVEAVTASTLLAAAAEAVDPVEREHVTPFVYRRPERFTCVPVVVPPWARRPDLRLTVDEPADLDLARALVARLTGDPSALLSEDVVRLLDSDEHLRARNQGVVHREVR